MSFRIQKVEYFYTSVVDQPGEAYKFLSTLAKAGINLLAFTAIPVGPMRTQLSIFPEDTSKFIIEAKNAGIQIDGPYSAILVQGDDQLGAFAEVHQKLYEANVNVYACTGVTDGKGTFGYLLYIRPEQFENAIKALNL